MLRSMGNSYIGMLTQMMVTMETIRLPAGTQQQLVGYTGSMMGSISSAVIPSLSQSKHQPLPLGYVALVMGKTCRRVWVTQHWWTAPLGHP